MQPGDVILQHFGEMAAGPALGERHTRWLRFKRPYACLSIERPGQVPALLERLRRAAAQGHYAAGYLAYEAAPAFDPAFSTQSTSAGAAPPPLGWFGLYESVQPLDRPPDPPETSGPAYTLSPWQAALTCEAYIRAIERIRAYIAAGDTYQVNFTQPLMAEFTGDPWALFLDLQRAQRGEHAAFIQGEGWVVASASPELFFAQDGDRVLTRPMKGTAPRGLNNADDDDRAHALAACPKNRAENIMIVDLLRNDLGRVARPGSVRVHRLCHVERFETILQMTSDVSASTGADPTETLAALFPCGSITGAPKIRTMQIIRELEIAPRGVYTGAIGWLGPRRQAVFNVAIRTVQLTRGPDPDGQPWQARFGVGGGVTWDSTPAGEYEECLAKRRLLLEIRSDFDLLETLLWKPGEGYVLLQAHLGRMADAARYFRYPFDRAAILKKMEALVAQVPPEPQRVRLLLAENGAARLESTGMPCPADSAPWRVALATQPVDTDNPFLRHKTTHRVVYDDALALCPDCDDVILWNARGEITESCRANVVIEIDGQRWTPPLACGLLPGVFRAQLLAEGVLAERVLTREDVRRAERLWLINSVRGWVPAVLAPEPGRQA